MPLSPYLSILRQKSVPCAVILVLGPVLVWGISLPKFAVAETPGDAVVQDPQRAARLARQILATFPKSSRGWRVGKGTIFGDQASAPDQGAGQRWRYLPTAARVYLAGRGTVPKQLRLRAILTPARWARQKRRQMARLAEKAPHCVSQPKIAGADAWLLGWFDHAKRKRQPKGNTCVPGARLVIVAGRLILTLSTSHHVGSAGLRIARAIDYKVLAALQAKLFPEPKEPAKEPAREPAK